MSYVGLNTITNDVNTNDVNTNDTNILCKIKYLPDDIKIIILCFLSPLKLIFVNKFFYLKFHQLYLLSHYDEWLEQIGGNETSLLQKSIQHIERNIIINKLNIAQNFNYSKIFIKLIIKSIKLNYVFLLTSLLNDGCEIIYKIEELMEKNNSFCKWLDLTHNNSNILYYVSLNSYIKSICSIYRPSKSILKTLNVYYFNKHCYDESIYDDYINEKYETIKNLASISFYYDFDEIKEDNSFVNNKNNYFDELNKSYCKPIILRSSIKRKDKKREKKQQKEKSNNNKKHKTMKNEWGNI
jgi:hypothetical protein